MSKRGPRTEFLALRKFVKEAERKFLLSHYQASSLGTPSREEELDVAAFVVLIHGAVENFVEGIGLWLINSIEKHWITNKRTSRPLASLLLHQPAPVRDFDETFAVFDDIRLSIDSAKTTIAKVIYDNNGIAMRHLREIFRPLGVNVPDDPQLSSSLDLLVSMRHQWAHQYRYSIKVAKFASDVKLTSDDCLVLAEKLAQHAMTARP
jgi:hypothetical protein